MASGFQIWSQEEARTHVQPKAHQGHYDFMNLRVPTWPQGPVTTSRTSGFPYSLRVPSKDIRIKGRTSGLLYGVRAPNLVSGSKEESPGSHTAPGLQSWSQYLKKNLRVSDSISGSKGEPPGCPMTSGSQMWCQGLEKPPGLPDDFRCHNPHEKIKFWSRKIPLDQFWVGSTRNKNKNRPGELSSTGLSRGQNTYSW